MATKKKTAKKVYIDSAKKNAVEALVDDKPYIKPIQTILTQAVVSGASLSDTIEAITAFVEGDEKSESKILKYVKQITNDSFAIADRSYTSLVSDELGNDWYYYAGSEVAHTRCFCKERVGNYYHYKEIEAWGKGENLGSCNIGDGKWAGEIEGTNESTIYSFLGGYNCMHSLIPVSESVVPDSDYARAQSSGFVE